MINISNKHGFTLIEAIVSIALIGIIAAIAGMGFINITEGYFFARDNSDIVQKAQVAMTRTVKELGAAAIINSFTTSPLSINYLRPALTNDPAAGTVTNTIAFSGNTVRVNGTILADNITAFTLTCYNAAGAQTETAADIHRVDISLTARGANSIQSTFTGSITLKESYL